MAARTADQLEGIASALATLNEMARENSEELSRVLTDKYRDLKEALVAAAGRGMEISGEAYAHTSAGLRRASRQVNRQVHEQPWITLGPVVLVALVAGVFIGRRWD